MERVLILGSRGMAGHLIKLYLQENSKLIVGEVARIEETSANYFNIDVTNLAKLDQVLNLFAPDFVINCIGVLNRDAEDNPDKAIFLNSFLPHYIARRGTELNFKLIHISTDCVFSGNKGRYKETDLKDGKGFYAQSKALGEVSYGNHITLRTSIVGPEIKNSGIGLLHWFLKSKEKYIKGYENVFWGGVTTLQLAKAILELINNPAIFGLIHLTNSQKISKFELLNIFNKVFNKEIKILPVAGYRVDKSLIATVLYPDISLPPTYEKMVIDLKAWMDSHHNIYSTIY